MTDEEREKLRAKLLEAQDNPEIAPGTRVGAAILRFLLGLNMQVKEKMH